MFRDLLTIFEQLTEDLGPLADLKAGSLINLFKQQHHARSNEPDQTKFNRGYYSIGQGSELVNIGKVSGWQDIRKVLKKSEGKYAGFIVYADGKAFGAVSLFGSTLSAPKRDDIRVAFDPTALPQDAINAQDKEVTRYDYSARKDVPTGQIKNPIRDLETRKELPKTITQAIDKELWSAAKQELQAATGDHWVNDEDIYKKYIELAKQRGDEPWEDGTVNRWSNTIGREVMSGKFRTGISITPEQLNNYINAVIEMLSPLGIQVTCTLISIDKAGIEKAQGRSTNKNYRDELATRQSELKDKDGYGSRTRSLDAALDRYKAGKNFNSFTDPNELSDFLTDSSNYGQTFVYNGKQFIYQVDAYYDRATVSAIHLLKGQPVEFRVSFLPTDSNSNSSLYVTIQLSRDGIKVVKVN